MWHVAVVRPWVRVFLINVLGIFLVSAAHAQITNVSDSTSTPIPGAGHDYIHLLSETVNPANGSVSLRIQAPMPQGRGITVPFYFGYDSNTVSHLVPGSPAGTSTWVGNTSYLAQGGWQYSAPMGSIGTTTMYIGNPQDLDPTYCYIYANYMFTDAAGGQHALNLGSAPSVGPSPGECAAQGVGYNNPSGDAVVYAFLPVLYGGSPDNGNDPAETPLVVYTSDGTVYQIPYFPDEALGVAFGLPTTIEDRNGNMVVVKDNGNANFTFTDTAGRVAVSSSGMGPSGTTNTLSFSGLQYTVAWETVSPSFTVPSTQINNVYGYSCSAPPKRTGNVTTVSQITLPNGGVYQFYYGANNPHSGYTNPYGLISEIDYPDGGWVRYTWKLSDTMNELAVYAGMNNGVAEPSTCWYEYETPVLATREVGFGGSSASLTQYFTYSTTWTPTTANAGNWSLKTTTVCTTDDVRGSSVCTSPTTVPANAFITTYSYTGLLEGPNNMFATTFASSEIPLESSVTVYNWGATTASSPLQTVNKTWNGPFQLTSQTTLVGSLSKLVTYTYGGFSEPIETDEYDWGARTPTRKTINTYQSFTPVAGYLNYLADKPCKTVVTDGSNNTVSETDFYYDNGTALCGTVPAPSVTAVSGLVPGTHDETNFGSGSKTPRGNLTKKVRWLNGGASPATTYTYDETGQVLSMKDPCGNGTCSDMSGTSHTTMYSYADNYSSGSPSGSTNAYLTQISNPSGQPTSFTYGYSDGQLTGATDPNSKTTTYKYNIQPSGCNSQDQLDRLDEIDYPDSGKTTLCYNDSAYTASTSEPAPSVTTTRTINSTQNEVSVTGFDGLGHTIETILSSAPISPVYSIMNNDGLGRPYQVSNPYRTTSDSTYGITTYSYDALGRPTAIQRPDGSVVNTSYSANSNMTSYCTTVEDEVGNLRQTCKDGLGRLVYVEEPGTTGEADGSPGTGSVAIGGQGDKSVTTGASSSSGTFTIVGVPPYSGTATISLSVGTTQVANYTYSAGESVLSVASALNGQINSSAASPVTSSCGPNNPPTCSVQILTLSSKNTGSQTNFALSAVPTSGSGTNQTIYVQPPSPMTGGSNGTTTWDSGTVSINVGGLDVSTTYGETSSSSLIASDLASQISQASGAPVTVAPLNGGSTINMTATEIGSQTNYDLSSPVVWNTQLFSSSSFTATSSGATLTGGTNQSFGSGPLVTQYQYDALDDLVCVVQKGTDTTTFSNCSSAPLTWRPRSFVYDSLSRLTSATNPESGTISYTYDANSNVTSKTAPQSNQASGTSTITINYSYDVDNRLTQKSYTGTVLQYGYDGTSLSGCGQAPPAINAPTNLIGRRSSMCAGLSASSWSYDAMGRTLAESRTNLKPGTPYTCKGTGKYRVCAGSPSDATNYFVGYTYFLDGSLQTLTYPSGDIVNYTVGGDGRPTQATDSNNNYVTSATYAPPGMLTGMNNGSGIVTTNIYNNRLQPISLGALAQGQAPFFQLCYDFHLGIAVNTPQCSFNANSTGNNGNLYQVVNQVDGTRSATYSYDSLNRLSKAVTNNATSQDPNQNKNCWGETYTVDAWGNLTNIAAAPGISGSCYSETLNAAPANNLNQLNGVAYDIAGNVINDGNGNQPTYDAENTMATDAGVTYDYDADGTRVEKSSGTMYWPGPFGTLAETDLTGTINEEYIYFNGERIARVDRPSGNVHYYFSDHLGSASVITDATGIVEEDFYYYPYGVIQSTAGSGDSNNYKFTGKERDSESGLDMFGARYYASTMGRFMTPDWSRDPDPIPYADYENPQTLNLYQYVENNPLNATDPDGHAHWGPCPNDSSAQCWTGDKNGEVDQNNGTVWNGKSQQWEQPPPSSSWQQFLDWRQQFKDNWDKRIEAHRPPPQKRDDNLQFLQNLNNLMMGMVAITEPLFRDITGKVHGDLPDHVPDNWTREDLEQAQHELQESIKARNAEQSKYGEEGGHRERIRREEHLLRQVDKKLGGS